MGKKIVFEEEIKKAIDEAQEAALDLVGQAVTDAMRTAIGELLGVRYDWGKWEFDPHRRVNGNNFQGSEIRSVVHQRANDLANELVDKALEEPLRFTASDINSLRTFLKQEVIEVTKASLSRKAMDIVNKYTDIT